ncbi:MAG: diadenylate cyclase [Desulfobacula sp.]|nr:diadenylate cyclase [Desulfobacula sp.]
MNLTALLTNIGIQDILDILFISIISYSFYIWFWGTQAFKALLGIVVLSGIYIIAKSWGLFLTTWVFQILWQVFVILLLILFQKEIRLILVRFNPLKIIGLKNHYQHDTWITGLAEWTFEAAKKRTGALIAFERKDLVFDLVTKGIAMECEVRPEILWSIFNKESPLHDGAVLISNEKISKASCFLPLCVREDLPSEWGTRHRAALGLTEQCDSIVLSISEERGEVSLITGNTFEKVKDKEHLASILKNMFYEEKDMDKGVKARIVSWFTYKYKIKAIIFTLVFILWLSLAGQQNYEKKIELPLQFRNIPKGLLISKFGNQNIIVTCRGLRKDVSLLNQSNVNSFVNLFSARQGSNYYNLTTGNINLPNQRIHLVNISPAHIELTFEKQNDGVAK